MCLDDGLCASCCVCEREMHPLRTNSYSHPMASSELLQAVSSSAQHFLVLLCAMLSFAPV